MRFLRALGIAASVGLAAVNVQARLQSREAGLSSLSGGAAADLYERDLGDLFEPDDDVLYARGANALYARGLDALLRARDLDTLLDERDVLLVPRAGGAKTPSKGGAAPSKGGATHSKSGATPSKGGAGGGKGKRGKCKRKKKGGHHKRAGSSPVEVEMGDAKFAHLGSGPGLATSGICGCIALAVVGSKGVVVAHVEPENQGAINKMKGLLMQVGSPAHATVYSPARNGRSIAPKEDEDIKRALGHTVPHMQTYPFDLESEEIHVLEVSNRGQVRFFKD